MQLSPKADFIKTDDAKKLADVVATPWFQHACVIALAHMQMEMGNAGNPAQGWDSFSQLCGARRYIAALLNLPDPNIKEPKKLSGELDYKV